MVQFEGQSAELVDTREKNQQRLDENRAVALKMDILEKYADVFFLVYLGCYLLRVVYVAHITHFLMGPARLHEAIPVIVN